MRGRRIVRTRKWRRVCGGWEEGHDVRCILGCCRVDIVVCVGCDVRVVGGMFDFVTCRGSKGGRNVDRKKVSRRKRWRKKVEMNKEKKKKRKRMSIRKGKQQLVNKEAHEVERKTLQKS